MTTHRIKPLPVFATVFLLLLMVHPVTAQHPSEVTDGFQRTDGWGTRKIVATGLVGAIMATSLYDSYNTWWKDAAKPFTFLGHSEENWLSGPHQGVDKPGHFFGTYALTRGIRNLLLWGGVDRNTAFWWAAGLGFWNGIQIEIGDGFSPYGFDYQDLVFDLGGVAYAMLQSELPALESFNFKFSYWSTTGIRSPANFTNDYDAMVIWLTMNMHHVLPASLDRYWPDFLQLSVGYGVDNHETRRKFAIGFDINLESFTVPSEDLLLAEKAVNLLHFPLPAVRMVEGKHPQYDPFFTK